MFATSIALGNGHPQYVVSIRRDRLDGCRMSTLTGSGSFGRPLSDLSMDRSELVEFPERSRTACGRIPVRIRRGAR